MAALFCDIPEAIANTRIVSDRLEFSLKNLGYEFPHYPMPEGETMDSDLDGGAVLRYSRGDCQHAHCERQAGVFAQKLGLRISALPDAGGRDDGQLSRWRRCSAIFPRRLPTRAL